MESGGATLIKPLSFLPISDGSTFQHRTYYINISMINGINAAGCGHSYLKFYGIRLGTVVTYTPSQDNYVEGFLSFFRGSKDAIKVSQKKFSDVSPWIAASSLSDVQSLQ